MAATSNKTDSERWGPQLYSERRHGLADSQVSEIEGETRAYGGKKMLGLHVGDMFVGAVFGFNMTK